MLARVTRTENGATEIGKEATVRTMMPIRVVFGGMGEWESRLNKARIAYGGADLTNAEPGLTMTWKAEWQGCQYGHELPDIGVTALETRS